MTTLKRYTISIIRLFLTTFIWTLAIQLQQQSLVDINSQVLVSLFLWAFIASSTTTVKFIQEKKLIWKFVNYLFKIIFKQK